MPEPKPRCGRRKFSPSAEQREQVSIMRSNGDALEIIAATIGISVPTLRRAFREELRDGHARIVSAISSVVVRSALGGNIAAARYWLATHGGPEWRVAEGRVIIDPELAKYVEDQRRMQAMTDEEIAAEIAEIDRKRALARAAVPAPRQPVAKDATSGSSGAT